MHKAVCWVLLGAAGPEGCFWEVERRVGPFLHGHAFPRSSGVCTLSWGSATLLDRRPCPMHQQGAGSVSSPSLWVALWTS